AEEIIFDDVTTGASQDIKQATKLARDMITRYGFSDSLGMVNYDNDDEQVFLGRDFGNTKSYSEDVASKIDEEVRLIIDKCYDEAKKLIIENKDILHTSAELLIEKERIGREEFEALFEDGQGIVQNYEKTE